MAARTPAGGGSPGASSSGGTSSGARSGRAAPSVTRGRRPASAVPLAPSPGLLAGALLPRRRPADLPDRVVEARGVAADPAHLDAWVRVCAGRTGAPVPGSLPGAFTHVLGSGASMRLLLDPAFPLPLLGLVHVAQRLEVRRPVDVREPLDLAVAARDLRPHRRGRQLDVVATATAAGEVVWRGTSTYLHREPAPAGAAPSSAGASSSPDAERPAPPAGAVRWVVPVGTGRAYAAVSGDPNPIHLSRPTARLLGFRRPIAHGMWTLAHALLDLEGRLPPAHDVTARFLRPLSLPGRAVHGWRAQEDGGLSLAVRRERDGEPHLLADVAPL
ncbi:MaoC/PaaZ C-terminal domain-containing protein [uncultured Pseudokineococcus sp.]|uniref:MaoC/PaaZ C-terminal domain-containing protein n=1 Tax=uncultured Pseudokineococcus sp. TaxID=1642928 RepID=UPI00261FB31C|nr:MaoC/PaaZ C-terminal domain-containing protein [uncultured Pseudokineococcus sp.]